MLSEHIICSGWFSRQSSPLIDGICNLTGIGTVEGIPISWISTTNSEAQFPLPFVAVDVKIIRATSCLEGRMFKQSLYPRIEPRPLRHLKSSIMRQDDPCPV